MRGGEKRGRKWKELKKRNEVIKRNNKEYRGTLWKKEGNCRGNIEKGEERGEKGGKL
jgi:hypothetical protein